ncbi:DUF445 domain-containing protein [Leptospira sp. 201903070]|uniref:DUF445 domain-containing protein n=1 Tax=Leptospira ainlahdjerensis TaxID=2810033 RepID=A0ABS2UD13_9LEPT|nr:DUF445 domain-containing protein [Leptospira ainlahdjerensis]MBM9576815.1 DUF445 domain-containing protein [Leptospira ainlahdjerensis]
MELLREHPQLFEIISILFTCSFVGWITNYIAVQMIFYPNDFIGIGNFGWQGIIPNHAVKMSSLIGKVLTSKVVRPHELYERVDPHQINDSIRDIVREKAKEIVHDVIVAENPTLWSLLPNSLKEDLEKEIRSEIPKQIEQIYKSFGRELDEVLELDEIIRVSLSGKNTKFLVEMFMRCGGPEFSFIIRSGIYFGFLIGLFQVAFINFFNQWWTMPIMGIAVGYYTNWLAILMIFRPLKPKRFLLFRYQGLFLKRQKEVSKEFAAVIASRVLNPENLIRLIFLGKGGDLIIQLVIEKAKLMTEDKLKEKAPFAPLLFGSERIDNLKIKIADHILWIIPQVADRIQSYITDSLQIEKTVADRLSVLPADEFESLLHSVFKEDEMTLIILGALMGGFVGLIQAYLVFMS